LKPPPPVGIEELESAPESVPLFVGTGPLNGDAFHEIPAHCSGGLELVGPRVDAGVGPEEPTIRVAVGIDGRISHLDALVAQAPGRGEERLLRVHGDGSVCDGGLCGGGAEAGYLIVLAPLLPRYKVGVRALWRRAGRGG